MTHTPYVLGIDVSKAQLDCCMLPSGEIRSFTNNPSGIGKLLHWMQSYDDSLLVTIEPSGGYEKPLQTTLLDNTISVAKVNARQVREFARAKGILAKTDVIDARILAEYGSIMEPRLLVPCGEIQEELSALVTRRRQLIDAIIAEKNHREKVQNNHAKTSIESVLELLTAQLADIDAAIEKHIKASNELSDIHRVITQQKGMGNATAAVLIAELPELGKITNKQISSLVGVAPHNRDSGTMRGKRTISGGRQTVRCALYMATMVAIRHNQAIKEYYQRLKENGKPPKVAIVAAMRKFLIITNAKVRDHLQTINP